MNLFPSGEAIERYFPQGGRLHFWPNWLGCPEAEVALNGLLTEVPWQPRPITIAGRSVLQPRLIAWFGDPGTHYSYSGLTLDPLPFGPHLAGIRARIENQLGLGFNSCLANLYRDGRDSIGFHADTEPELGPNPTIASISLGATRRFVLKRSDRRAAEPPFELALSHGSLLLMSGTLQHHYKHGVPKTAKPVGTRINLTFRRILAG